jgi:hypothetical protein
MYIHTHTHTHQVYGNPAHMMYNLSTLSVPFWTFKPKCPLTENGPTTCVMSIKRNKVPVYAMIWMDYENVFPSQRSQPQRPGIEWLHFYEMSR